MNKLNHKLIILCGIMLGVLAACEKPEIPESGESKNLIVSVYNIEQEDFPALTRATISQYFGRLNFAVYDSVGTRVKQVNQQRDDKDFGTAGFNLPQGKYKVVVVAHSSNGNPTMTDMAKIRFENSDGFTDTFMSYDSVEIAEDPVSLPVSIRRISTLCRFVLTDTIPSEVTKMRFLYTGGSGAFNAATGLGSVNSKQTEFFDVEVGKDSTSYDLYTFLHDKEGTIHVQATAYNKKDDVLNDRTFDIPLKRCKITKVTGQYFNTASSSITILIDFNPEWDGVDEISF